MLVLTITSGHRVVGSNVTNQLTAGRILFFLFVVLARVVTRIIPLDSNIHHMCTSGM